MKNVKIHAVAGYLPYLMEKEVPEEKVEEMKATGNWIKEGETPKVITAPPIIQTKPKVDFSYLEKIKGVGKETTEDLERIYSTESELIEALKADRVPMRNDVNEKLKKYFKIGEEL